MDMPSNSAATQSTKIEHFPAAGPPLLSHRLGCYPVNLHFATMRLILVMKMSGNSFFSFHVDVWQFCEVTLCHSAPTRSRYIVPLGADKVSLHCATRRRQGLVANLRKIQSKLDSTCSVAYRRGYVLRNASLGDFVVVRTS